ncbi:MAG: EEP domain-containing protein [Pseudomonadales bacterium]|nr:EEP domain-containing protein [Pseudomonadales bacterium]
MDDFRVLTLNIHKGFSLGNRRFTLQRIRDNLRETGSNIVFLQEVIGEHEKHREAIADWPESNQFEYLADTVWDHYAYGKNAIYQHGHHGNAILSELPFSFYNNFDISTLPVSQRGILHGQLENNVHLLCVHLGLFELERRRQLDKLLHYIDEQIDKDAPLILAGDFNDWRKTAHKRIKAEWGMVEAGELFANNVANTFPAVLPVLPVLPMDRIYLRGFSVTGFEVMANSCWRQISDHCAVQTDLRLDN